LSNRVRVAHGDATAFDPQRLFGRENFDRIFISYSISMIPDWNGAIDRALALLAPDGELHIVDFGGQSGLPGLFRSGLRRWLKLFHVTPRDGLERWLSGCAKRRGAMLTVQRPFRDYAQYAVLRLAG
jgi:S-adenosylmethionine-diacylgycerolhomoserine-N-methlytransferase